MPVLGLLATWAPWLPIMDRPIFSFYAVATLPFMIIALCLVIDLARRQSGSRHAAAMPYGWPAGRWSPPS